MLMSHSGRGQRSASVCGSFIVPITRSSALKRCHQMPRLEGTESEKRHPKGSVSKKHAIGNAVKAASVRPGTLNFFMRPVADEHWLASPLKHSRCAHFN